MASALLIAFWSLASAFVALSGFIHTISPHTPQFFQDLLLYGKARGKRKEKTVLQYLEIPNRYEKFLKLPIIAHWLGHCLQRKWILQASRCLMISTERHCETAIPCGNAVRLYHLQICAYLGFSELQSSRLTVYGSNVAVSSKRQTVIRFHARAEATED